MATSVRLNLLAFGLLFLLANNEAKAGIELRADRITQEDDGNDWLHLTLWNCSTKPLKVVTALAPWGDELTLALYETDRVNGRVWQQPRPMEHFPLDAVIVAPGGHTEGKRPLWFGQLGANSKFKGPFVLFWSYNTGWLDENLARQLSGTLNIGIGGDERRPQGSPCGRQVTASKRR